MVKQVVARVSKVVKKKRVLRVWFVPYEACCKSISPGPEVVLEGFGEKMQIQKNTKNAKKLSIIRKTYLLIFDIVNRNIIIS